MQASDVQKARKNMAKIERAAEEKLKAKMSGDLQEKKPIPVVVFV